MYKYLLEIQNPLFRMLIQRILFSYLYFKKKDKNIWIFGSMRGQKYTDNAKYLFEYIDKHTIINAVWISKNKEIVSSLNKQGYTAFYENTPEAISYASRAKIAVITHRGNRQNGDLPFYAFSKKTKIVQLWHGIPLKKIAYDDKIFSFKQDEENLSEKLKLYIKTFIFPFLNYVNKPSLIISLSDDSRKIFSKAFRMSEKNVKITGYPRNDALLNDTRKKDNIKKKKIIYMPTFRGDINSKFDLFLQYNFNLEKLDTYLFQNNICLDIKLHPFNRPSDELMKQLVLSRNITVIDVDLIYDILEEYNLLITDYSSVYFDYLLLDRPIIFAPFDKEIYLEKDREFYFDYDEVTPGPKAKDWDEVISCIEMFEKNSSLFEEQRVLIKNRFHTYQDTNSTKRVYESILEIIK